MRPRYPTDTFAAAPARCTGWRSGSVGADVRAPIKRRQTRSYALPLVRPADEFAGARMDDRRVCLPKD